MYILMCVEQRKYFNHVKKYPDTFLVRLYGMHRIKLDGRTTHFIIMGNVFPSGVQIHRKFDLKGSKVGSELPDWFRTLRFIS